MVVVVVVVEGGEGGEMRTCRRGRAKDEESGGEAE